MPAAGVRGTLVAMDARPAPNRSSPFAAGSWVLIAVAVGLHLAATLAAEPLRSANDRSRWATVRALLETGAFRIDPYEFEPRWSTIDQVQVGGHLYSTKPALLPLAVAGLTAGAERVAGAKLGRNPEPVTRAVLVMLNVVPFGLMLWSVRGLLVEVARTDHARWIALATLAFGTPVSAFVPVLNNHTPAACALGLALPPLVRIARGSRRAWRFALAGLLCGLTVVNELPAGLFAAAAGLASLRADWRRALGLFAPAATVPVLVLLAATVVQTGSLTPFYAGYGGPTYEFVRRGVPSYWLTPSGLDTNPDGIGIYLFHCTLGHHGPLLLSPAAWLAVGSVVWAAWRRVRGGAADRHPLGGFVLVTAAVVGGVLVFYLSRSGNRNYGGVSVALRWLIWTAPAWALATVPVCDRLAGVRWFRAASCGLVGLSVASVWADAPDPWQYPWAYRTARSLGWTDHAPPRPADFSPRVYTWFDPAAVPGAGGASATYTRPTPAGGLDRLTLSLTRQNDHPPRFTVTLNGETWSGSFRYERVATAAAGRRPAEWFVRRPPGWVSDLLHGSPAAKPYNRGRRAITSVGLRRDAFAARRRAVRVPIGGRAYRVDAWCVDTPAPLPPDPVPFGTLRWTRTVSDARTGVVLDRETWTLAAADPPPLRQSPLTPTAVRSAVAAGVWE